MLRNIATSLLRTAAEGRICRCVIGVELLMRRCRECVVMASMIEWVVGGRALTGCRGVDIKMHR